MENNIASYLINDSTELDPDWLKDISTIGVTAGASAPEELVEELLERIESYAEIDLELVTSNIETDKFHFTQELRSVDIIN